MSHIKFQSERDENQAMNNCPYRSVARYVEKVDYETNETYSQWDYSVNECGETEYISTAKDRCKRCGKVFTY